MRDEFEVEKLDEGEQSEAMGAIAWFAQNTDLRRVSFHEATESDKWAVFDDDECIALALIESGISKSSALTATVFRLGVREDYRRQGIGSAILDRLNEEYGKLSLDCRESLPANEFYEAIGFEKHSEMWGDPEDLIRWQREEA